MCVRPILALVLACQVVSTVWAQAEKGAVDDKPAAKGPEKEAPKPTPMPGTGHTRAATQGLLEKPAIRKELKLTLEQREHLKTMVTRADAMCKECGEQYLATIKAFGDADPDEVAAYRRDYTVGRQAMMSSIDQAFLKLLDKPQRERLFQIRLQTEGPIAFLNPELQERLKLSPEQVKQIAKVLRAGRERMELIADRVQEGDADSFVPKDGEVPSNASRASLAGEIEKLLPKLQREAYQKLLGKPFVTEGPEGVTTAPALKAEAK